MAAVLPTPLVLERRQRAFRSRLWLEAEREEWLRRDPGAAARGEEWARRLLAGEFTVRGEGLAGPDSAGQT
ncbi:hypothetical protein [Nonomuraea sp. NPDC049784]|uniref:hypothetical protein n=1 Tax=Nonomuraea sp. NPDC049784 TaxID=3154361 RepID=UPI0033E87985